MSTQRYCGDVRVRLTYVENTQWDARWPHGRYRCVVVRGKDKRTVWVGARVEHGSGIGVDSPEAFDSVASAAIAFADHEDEENGVPHGCRVNFSDDCEYDEQLSGLVIRRKR